QAAFVDYGGNRHGFLAFNEIHPDYYQIPHADRQALIEAESAARRDDDDSDDDDQADVMVGEAIDEADSDPTSDVALETAADDDMTVGDADPDIEAAAIDVSDLLPPEPAEPQSEADAHDVLDLTPAQVDSAATAVIDEPDEPAPNATEHDVIDIAASLPDVDFDAPAEPFPDIISEAADGDSESPDRDQATTDGDSDNSDQPRSGPKSIAAAVEPDERIVSDIIENGSSDESIDDTVSENSPADGKTPTADSMVVLDSPAARSDSIDADDDVPAGTVAAQTDGDDPPSTTDDLNEPTATDGSDSDPRPSASDDDNDAETVEARAPSDDEDDDDDRDDDDLGGDDLEAPIDDVGEADALEELPSRPRRRVRNYKIQEVIKRRQVVLVQVVKEERGNKGAALTTYLSLAGRYTVLMPNTARGGGISRKITNLQDRKRLKAIAQELDVPEGMGLIIRTAGAARTKQEIKRDFEYLLRLWENVRDLTLQSTAPSLVYEEGDLIKRSIRDLYSKDVEQILVAGESAHKEAKSFMRMLMPSHAKNVIKYEEPQPLFARYRIEQQLNAMFSPFVQLRSGGYLVINQTEALVAVDVNSGKSTRKFSIEETALNTNLEAAEELSRQLKLRDLAGLIVIDFIDMEEKRNNRAVERRLKECLRDDRARIQVGRISHFGLLEMSRQRLRTGVLEGSTMPCHHCQGTGIIRSTESVALAVLRALEDQLMAGPARPLTAQCSGDVAMYLLNQKRGFVQEIEERYGVTIHVEASDTQQGADFAIERVAAEGAPAPRRNERAAVNVQTGFADSAEESEDTRDAEGDERRPRRRRRRRGRRSEGEAASNGEADDQTLADEAAAAAPEDASAKDSAPATEERNDNGDGEERSPRRRRRGRRGGRRNRGEDNGGVQDVAAPGAPQPEIAATSDDKWSDNGDPAVAAPDLTASDVTEQSAAPETAEVPDTAAAHDAPALGDAEHAALHSDDSEPSGSDGDVALDDVEPTPQRDEPIAAAVTALEIVAPDSASDEQEPRPRGEPVSSEPVL
ncbi:MAG: Rne/Rng family ribonuclease, partial [Hyphomicrobiaceae bacterium]